MQFCPKSNGKIMLTKDRYDRFERFFECQNCNSRFWMSSNRELTKKENSTVKELIANTTVAVL